MSAFSAVANVQRLMSFHDPASELSQLNREAFRRPVQVHDWTASVLTQAQELAVRSDGVFDITIAPLLCRWGYLPPNEGTDAAATFRDVILLPGQMVRFARPLAIDLGGIAKGFAVDRAVQGMIAAGVSAGAVNAGGDLRVFGHAPQQVHLRDPARPQSAAGVVQLQNRALATSGVYFSRSRHGGAQVSPLVDGQTREPLVHDISVAVSAQDCMTADALTKVVLARGDKCAALLQSYAADAVLLERGKGPRVLSADAPEFR
jgi:FAD:protein FMN transferase